MNKGRFFLIILLALFFSATSTEAAVKEHVVAKGECLWLIGQKYGVSWPGIAKDNNILGPKYVIYPKQKLVINPWIWKDHGKNKYKSEDFANAINSFRWMPDEVKTLFIKEVESGNYLDAELVPGDHREEMVFRNGVKGNLIVDGNKEASKRYTVRFENRVYILDRPLICDNWTWASLPQVPVFVDSEFPPVPVFADLPPVPVFMDIPQVPVFVDSEFPPVPISECQEGEICGFDLYIGGGIYQTDKWLNSNNKDYDHTGWYIWGKGRYRPIGFDVSDEIRACFGVFAFGAFGKGNDEGYEYSWKKWSIGPSLKLISEKNWDADFDLGLWGKLYSEGEKGLYKSEQIDNIFLFSSHLNLYNRRAQGEKWFPKTELNLEITIPWSESHNHWQNGKLLSPDPYDNQSLEILWEQYIYDYEKGDWLFSPGFNLAFIQEYGRENPSFIQFGPNLSSSWFDEDVFSISFFNYKENLGGDGDQCHWLSGNLSISGLIKSYRASRIKEASAEDLEI